MDAIYINNSGGKILLDYLIKELEQTELEVHYLLDVRIKNAHPEIKSTNQVCYLKAGIRSRTKFYKINKSRFSKILCFANLPPYVLTAAITYTYFHQPLLISNPSFSNWKLSLSLAVRRTLIKFNTDNTNFWIVQSDQIKNGLLKRFESIQPEKIKIIPFYNSVKNDEQAVLRKVNAFIYVSSAALHKNHIRLMKAFTMFYDKHHVGELHLTIEAGSEIAAKIAELYGKGYPIINHGFIPQNELSLLYKSCQYSIYPSLAESFGLGIIEAIENGCKMLGADKAYMHAICEPSLLFDPESVDDMVLAFEKACFSNLNESKLLVQNKNR